MRKLLTFSILFLVSCGGSQKADFRPSEINLSAKKLEACANFSPTQNPLEKKSLANIFSCLSWDEQYPDLYQLLLTLDEKNWNSLTLSWNKYLFSTENKIQWDAFRKSELKPEQVSNLLKTYFENEKRLQFPVIKNSEEKKIWLDIISNYEIFSKLLESFEIWHENYQYANVQDYQLDLDFSKKLSQTMAIISKQSSIDESKLNKFKKIMQYQQEGKSWLLYWASHYEAEKNYQELWQTLFLDPNQVGLLKLVPALNTIIEQGLPCSALERNTKVVIKESYLEKIQELDYANKDEAMLCVMDLKIKLLGLKNYCNIVPGSKGIKEYEIAQKTIFALEEIVLNNKSYEVLQSALHAFKSSNLTTDKILKIYALEWVNQILSIWNNKLNEKNFAKFATTAMSSFTEDNWNDLNEKFFNVEMLKVVKLISLNPDISSQFFNFTTQAINLYLKNNESAVAPLARVFFTKEIIQDLVNRYDQYETKEIKQKFFSNVRAKNDFINLISSNKWVTILDLLYNQKSVQKVSRPRSEIKINAPVKNQIFSNYKCFKTIHRLSVNTLEELIYALPQSCLSVAIRSEKDFSFRVVQDFSKINHIKDLSSKQKIFSQWGVLDTTTLRMVGDLLLKGERYKGGFEVFWEDLKTIFYKNDFKMTVNNLLQSKNNSSLEGLPDFHTVAPLIKKVPLLFEDLKSLPLDKNISYQSVEKIILDNKLGSYVEFFTLLSEKRLIAKVEHLIANVAIREGRLLQIILNDLVNSTDWKETLKFYDKLLKNIETKPSFSKIMQLTEKEKNNLKEVQKVFDVFYEIDKVEYQGNGGMKMMLEFLKNFKTNNPIYWSGKYLNLLLSPAEVSSVLKLFVNLCQNKILSQFLNVVDTVFNKNELVRIKNILNVWDKKKLWHNLNTFKIDSNLEDFLSRLSRPKEQAVLKRLEVLFLDEKIDFSIISKSFKSNFDDQLLVYLRKKDPNGLSNFEIFFEYYFSNYGPSLNKMAKELNTALDGRKI